LRRFAKKKSSWQVSGGLSHNEAVTEVCVRVQQEHTSASQLQWLITKAKPDTNLAAIFSEGKKLPPTAETKPSATETM
jgi:hypothetical protein